MITEKVYLEMKRYIDEYENKKLISNDSTKPYLCDISIEKQYKYNPEYGNERICKCGHSYYRHFDTYEDMYACGCKYCECDDFNEK